jgi:hypothetical protein
MMNSRDAKEMVNCWWHTYTEKQNKIPKKNSVVYRMRYEHRTSYISADDYAIQGCTVQMTD